MQIYKEYVSLFIMELNKAYSTNNEQNAQKLKIYPIQKICNCVDGSIITTNDGNRKQTCTICGNTWKASLIDDVIFYVNKYCFK